MNIKACNSKKLRADILGLMFLIANASYAIGFVLLSKFDEVTSSSLYQSFSELHPNLPMLWGAVLMAAILLTIGINARTRPYTRHAGTLLGVVCWSYAAITYLIGGFILVFIAVSLLYLVLWLRLYFLYVSTAYIPYIHRVVVDTTD